MIFVIRVFTGKEEEAQNMIRRVVPWDVYAEIFSPERVRQKKFRGSWHEVRERLVPGYLFVETDEPAKLYDELRHVPTLTKMLGKQDNLEFIELPKRDLQWLKKALGLPVEEDEADEAETNRVRSSSAKETGSLDVPGGGSSLEKGMAAKRKNESLSGREVALTLVEIAENGEVKILDGPLKNIDAKILKYDLHKRQAEVEIQFLGRPVKVYMGICIKGKDKKAD